MDSEFLDKIIKLKNSLESEIQSLNYLIGSKKEQIRELNEYIYKNCEHIWEEDIIDLFERSNKIVYCKNCELTK
tara:strand:- start:363 stop:584 length:222 start_codon:yes stop_codon:yes gene_type:complete